MKSGFPKFHRGTRWLGSIISIALLIWVISIQDWNALKEFVTSWKGLGVTLGSVAFVILGQVFAAWRWTVLLRAENKGFRFREAFRLLLISAFLSNFLPTSIGGDVVRLIGVSKGGQARGAASIVVDRAVSLVSMLALVPVSVVFAVGSGVSLTNVGAPFVKRTDVALGVTISQRIRSFFSAILAWLKKFRDALLSWRKHPRSLAVAFLLAWGSFACGWASVWLLAYGLGIDVTYFEVVSVGVGIYIIGLMPLALNGIGLQEAGYVFFYTQLGAPADLAATLGFLVRLVYLLGVMPGSLWWMLQPQLRTELEDYVREDGQERLSEVAR